MQGCHHQARRAKENSPVIDHWVRVSLCPKSRPGRPNRRQLRWPASRSDQSSRQAIPSCHFSTALLLKNTLCKYLVLQHVTFAAKAPKILGSVATGFPLPSTGRGIEGEGWSYPEPPLVRFFLYQPHPGSRTPKQAMKSKRPAARPAW